MKILGHEYLILLESIESNELFVKIEKAVPVKTKPFILIRKLPMVDFQFLDSQSQFARIACLQHIPYYNLPSLHQLLLLLYLVPQVFTSDLLITLSKTWQELKRKAELCSDLVTGSNSFRRHFSKESVRHRVTELGDDFRLFDPSAKPFFLC